MTLYTLKTFFLKHDLWLIFSLIFINFTYNAKFSFFLLVDSIYSTLYGHDYDLFSLANLNDYSLILLILTTIPPVLIVPIFEEYVSRSWLKTKLSKTLSLSLFLIYIFLICFVCFTFFFRNSVSLPFLNRLSVMIGVIPSLMLFTLPFSIALAFILNRFSVGVYLEKLKSKTSIRTLFISNWIIFFLLHAQYWFDGIDWYILTIFVPICAIFPYIVLRYGLRLSILIHILLNFTAGFTFTPYLNGSQVFLYYLFYITFTASLVMVIILESTRLKKLETKA